MWWRASRAAQLSPIAWITRAAPSAVRLLSSSSSSSGCTPGALTGKNFIGGRLSGAGADVYAALSPLGQRALPCEFHNATADEIAEAAAAAARAFRSYRRTPPAERAAFLRQIGAEIEGLGEALIERAHEETGLPLPRLRNERARTVDQLKKFAKFVEEGSWVHAHSVVGSGVNIRRMQVPVGPVAVFGASNFPLAFSVAGGDTAAALAAGCPVVVKVHPGHPGTSELVASAVQAAVEKSKSAGSGSGGGVPPGVFSMLHGTTPAIAAALVTRPEIKAVGFTGSHRAGRALFDLCAARCVRACVRACVCYSNGLSASTV
jgi:alpha-ketoglutaric semialdehyde dehydrogenase